MITHDLMHATHPNTASLPLRIRFISIPYLLIYYAWHPFILSLVWTFASSYLLSTYLLHLHFPLPYFLPFSFPPSFRFASYIVTLVYIVLPHLYRILHPIHPHPACLARRERKENRRKLEHFIFSSAFLCA